MTGWMWMLACHHNAVPRPAPHHRRVVLKDEGYPNGLAMAPDGTLFVGFVDHGRIMKRSPDGTVDEAYAGGELFAATSLRFDPRTNLLWVTSPDFPGAKKPHRLGVVDVERGEVLWSLPIPDEGFGNDLVLDQRGGVLLTDSTRHVVHRIDPRGQWGTAISLPHGEGDLEAAGIGILPDGDWVVGRFASGDLLRIRPSDSKTTTITSGLENPDGLLVQANGDVLVLEAAIASGRGRLIRVDPSTGLREVVLAGLDSPLNLTATPEGVVLSESRVRHLLREGRPPTQPPTLVDVELHGSKTVDTYVHLPNGMFPESVAVDDAGDVFVGSATSHGILRVANGKVTPFVDPGTHGLMSVQGLFASKTRLYACTANLGVHEGDVGRSALVAFDLSNGEPMGRWPLPEDGLCNDITELPNGDLLVSDSTAPRIWRFDMDELVLQVWLEDPLLGGSALNGNGIAWSNPDSSVYLSTFSDGRLLRIPVLDDVAQRPVALNLSRALVGADAVRVVGPGRLLVFENGLTANEGGAVTSVVVEDGTARMARLWASEHQPTSGWVHEDGSVTVVESHFESLFGSRTTDEPAPQVLRRLTEPVLGLWALQ